MDFEGRFLINFPSVDNETYHKQSKKSCTVFAFSLPCCILVYPVRKIDTILGISNKGYLWKLFRRCYKAAKNRGRGGWIYKRKKGEIQIILMPLT